MPRLRFYTTKVTLDAVIRVEAESDEEAERIVDGVLLNASFVQILECPGDDPEDFDDALVGVPGTISRDALEPE